MENGSKNNSDNLNKHWPDLCSSCWDVISPILSIGEPSYLGELFEESFDYNSLLDSPFDDNEFRTEVGRAKAEVISIQSHKVTTTADKVELERIQPLVEAKDVKASAFPETNQLDESKRKTPNISAGNIPAPLDTKKDGRKRCKSNYNIEDLRDEPKGSPKCKFSKLDNANPATLNISGNEYSFNISNTIQMEMTNEESERIIEEFRKECDEILNPPEMNTLPSIEQYKMSQLESRAQLLDKEIGYNSSNIRTVRRTDSSVGALVLSTFTNAEKRSILGRRKTILLTLNRLLNLTSYINNTAKLGQMSGANTFNNGLKNQN